jgi:hypothetical protein
VRGRELRQGGDDEMSAAKLLAAAAADAAPLTHKTRSVGVDKEHVTCVHLHHELEVAEVPACWRRLMQTNGNHIIRLRGLRVLTRPIPW